MFEALYQGFLTGLALSVMVGPVFFTLLQTSLQQGFRAGSLVALGIALSDSSYILAAVFLSAQILKFPYFKEFLAIGGGTLLLTFGIYYLLKTSTNRATRAFTVKTIWSNIIKGIVINGLNPMVLIFWLVISSYANAQFEGDGTMLRTYFITSIVVVLSFDLTKAYLAKRLSQMLSEKLMLRFNKLVGIALILFAIRLYYTLFETTAALVPENPILPGS